jgi:hypothetical protein
MQQQAALRVARDHHLARVPHARHGAFDDPQFVSELKKLAMLSARPCCARRHARTVAGS